MNLKIGATTFALVAMFAVAGSVFAVETTGDSMMKKSDSMTQKDTMTGTGDSMMKKDAVMSGDTMTHEEDLFFGSRGDKVVTLQMLLEEKGLLMIPAGVAKGYFGPLTKAAVMKHQTMLGVKSTGYYGPLTRAAMKVMMQKKDGAMMNKGDSMMKKDEGMMMSKKAHDVIALNTVVSASSKIGTYLVAGDGMTLYRFTKDSAGVSNCAGDCIAKWPAYNVSAGATISAGAGVTGAVGTITRADGTIQATYNGAPLYFWSKDMKAGDTTGQDVNGVWFVVNP